MLAFTSEPNQSLSSVYMGIHVTGNINEKL
jgi:hypothetical protein